MNRIDEPSLGPQLDVAHLVFHGGGVLRLDDASLPVAWGRSSFGPFVGRLCLSREQWWIGAIDGTPQLKNVGSNPTCVWFPKRDPVVVGPGEMLQLLDGCCFGVRYWTAEGADGTETRRALCTFWADSLAACDSNNGSVYS
jgi:hypothetical protein